MPQAHWTDIQIPMRIRQTNILVKGFSFLSFFSSFLPFLFSLHPFLPFPSLPCFSSSSFTYPWSFLSLSLPVSLIGDADASACGSPVPCGEIALRALAHLPRKRGQDSFINLHWGSKSSCCCTTNYSAKVNEISPECLCPFLLCCPSVPFCSTSQSLVSSEACTELQHPFLTTHRLFLSFCCLSHVSLRLSFYSSKTGNTVGRWQIFSHSSK